MNINTRFEVGQEVIIIDHNAFRKAEVKRIEIEVNNYPSDKPKPPAALIKYCFDLVSSGNYRDYRDYRYEEEVWASREDLIERLSCP